jgi:L-seryl-tRNA(Ser) seleniumtransferase
MDSPDPVNARLRRLPAVERLVEAAGRDAPSARWSLLAAARRVLATARAALVDDPSQPERGLEALAGDVRELAAELEGPAPRRVLNATGVVIHTNLGRAPLGEAAALEVGRAASSYSDLEYDLESGTRGSRLERVSRLLVLLSGAEAAMVVNNNAAGLLLAVDALAAGREVILSRGELVEIGGSFRVPEIMETSRARLRSVGTTNRTHLRDYEAAIGPETGMLLKVHRSNFEIRGFTAEVSIADLAALAAPRGIPVVEDRGSGTFLDLRPHGIPEAAATQGLRDGADLVLFSGDKLLGGPQAGIVLGRGDLVERMRKSPLARALRVDKMTLAALDWTLRGYLDGSAQERVPVLRMLLRSPAELRERAEAIAAELKAQGWKSVSVEREGSLVGGGALPDVELPGAVVRLVPSGSVDEVAGALRRRDPAVVVRARKGAILIDPRTLSAAETREVVAAFAALIDSSSCFG